MEIQKVLLTPSPYTRRRTVNRPKEIIVHYVGNPNTSAIANRNYFESLRFGVQDVFGNFRKASSQYIIGLQGEILLCIPEDEEAIHSGNNFVNITSIGIEVCHPDWSGKFTDVTMISLIELCADICRRYHLDPLTNIRRHHDVTGKDCPRWFVSLPKEFESFKASVKAFNEELEYSDDIDKIVEVLVRQGFVGSPIYWKRVLRGEQTVDPAYLTLLFDRLFIQTLKDNGTINSPDHWRSVVDGKQELNPDYLVILLKRLLKID